MKKMVISFATVVAAAVVAVCSPVRSNLGGDGEEYGEVEPYTAASYVQEGLFLMYDGIENVGWGEHDSSATTMADLGPYGLSFPLNTAGGQRFEEDCLFVPKYYYTPRTINLPDDAYAELMMALSNATFTVEYVWVDNGSDYSSSDGLGVMGPIKICGERDTITGCRVDSYRGNFWSSGYGYYWGPVMRIADIQMGGSYSAMIYGKETEYKLKEVIRYNDLYAVGTAPNDSSTLHGTWHQRMNAIFTTRQLMLFPSRNRLTGRLYNLRIYTRALSMEEMAHNWNVDRERFGVGL